MKCRPLLLALVLPLLGPAPAAHATDFYVSPSGSDAGDGSLGAPYQTIHKALATALPGDSVKLRAGTYREMLNPVRSGTAAQPITIENFNGELAVISALDAVPGPWSAQGNGIFATPVSGSRPLSFWTTAGTSANGTGIAESGGNLLLTVANESANHSTSTRSSAASAAWDFFSQAVTWQVRGLSAASTGATPLPATNMNLFFSIMNAANIGFSSEDAVNVAYRGDGRLALNLKKNTVNSWGPGVHTVSDPAITGFDLTLGPAAGASVPYTFAVKKSSGADVVFTGSWSISQAEWTDGGTGNTSYLGLFAQENVTATDLAQTFSMAIGSYTVTASSTVALRDEFDDGDAATVSEFPAAPTSSLSSGYDQVFVDGAMLHEARTPNHGAGGLLQPATAGVTVTNASAASNPNTVASSTFGGQSANFYAGARFVGGIGSKWSWQNAVVSASSGNLLTLDPVTKSTWWWPDQTGTSNTDDTGTGFVYGLLNLLDADGEWFLDQPTATLFLRISGAADPAGHLVEIKRRNWCINVGGYQYLTLRGLRTIGGAIRLDGSGLILENCDATYLSHFLVWSNGGTVNGGRTEGGGVVVSGTGNTVRGCTIHDTAGSGVTTSGSGHLITRNQLFNIDYSGTYAAPLALGGNDITATFNTIHDTGRDGIRPTGAGLTVLFNDVSAVGRLTHDLACIYTWGTDANAASGKRTRIAYNWVHDRGDSTDSLSKGIYLDNGCRNFLVDHNVCWNVASSATQGAFILNSPAFGHELYHNTIVSTGGYNESTYTTYPSNTTFNGYVFTDATHGLDFDAQSNLRVPAASTASAFENFGAQDFTPQAGYHLTDRRYVASVPAVDPPPSSGSVEWIKASGNTTLTNPYLTLSMTNPTAPFFYREAYGHGQSLAGINTWVPDGKPDSGAYERGVARWVPGVAGWEGLQADPPPGIGARTAILQGVRVSVDTSTATLRLCYGTADGGTSEAAWQTVADLGTVTPSDVMTVIQPALSSLAPGTAYSARFLATTASGSAWSEAQTFVTAASLTWDAGGGTGTGLSNPVNWLGDPTPDLVHGGEIATFGSAGGTAVVDSDISLLGIVINRDGNFTLADGAGSLTLGGSGITVTLPTPTARTHAITESNLILGADQIWSISNNTGAAAVSVASSITDGAGSFGFTKTGTGTVTLTGSSDYEGITNVNMGILAITHGQALGSTAGATAIATTGSVTTGGQVRVTGDLTTAENFLITGTTEAGSFARAIENASGTSTLSGSITLVGNSQIRIGAAAGTLHLDGPIARSGADNGAFMLVPSNNAVITVTQPMDLNGGAFNISGIGTVTLLAAGHDIGPTTLFFGNPAPNGPVLQLGTDDALPTNRNLTLGTTGTSNGADRGTLDLAGFHQTVNALNGFAGTGATPSAASTRRVTNSAAGTVSTLTAGNGGASATFNGLIEDGAGQVALVKVGSGTLTLPTAHSYTGDTTVNGGTLSLATASLADSAAVNLSSGAVLNLNYAGTDTIGSLRINGLIQAPGTWGSLTSTATNKTALLTGTGLLSVTGTQPPYDAWAVASGLDNTPNLDASPIADPDRDGMPNLLEYATRMNPAQHDPAPQSAAKNGSVLEFLYRKNKAATDVSLTVEWSDDLSPESWNSSGVSTAVQSDDGVTQQFKATLPAGPARRFVRLNVARP